MPCKVASGSVIMPCKVASGNVIMPCKVVSGSVIMPCFKLDNTYTCVLHSYDKILQY